MSDTLTQFKEYLKKMNYYDRAGSLLYWDMRTICPPMGEEGHADALTFFSTESFAMSTSEELGKFLDTLAAPEEYDKLDETMKFVVKRMKRDYDKNKRIPKDFYEEYVKENTASEMAWEKAKQNSDYSVFAPHLEKVIEFTKKLYGYTDPDKEVYDAMLDTFEEGMDSATIDGLFEDLKKELVPLVKAIIAAKQPDDSKFRQHYDIESQKKVQEFLLKYIGFNFEAGTVGETEHPFTLNFSPYDVRVSNHYADNDALSGIFTAIHEGGHAVFEQNVNPAYDGTVAGSCCYMGVHESQSRFFENILGRNKNFWSPIYGQLQELLPQYKDITLDEFYHEINHVRNSFIRCDADELTYCLHIVLRYEMEKAIFRDNVSVDKLPQLWNQKMQEYLQITPTCDAEGILQDMHWSDGSFGYFPSYLLGSIYDGMFLDAVEKDLGSVDTILAEGKVKNITKWLNENIHYYGSTRTPSQVIDNVCKKPVSAEPIIRHFKKKYTELYKL